MQDPRKRARKLLRARRRFEDYRKRRALIGNLPAAVRYHLRRGLVPLTTKEANEIGKFGYLVKPFPKSKKDDQFLNAEIRRKHARA